jgi:hypothetical protein
MRKCPFHLMGASGRGTVGHSANKLPIRIEFFGGTGEKFGTKDSIGLKKEEAGPRSGGRGKKAR